MCNIAMNGWPNGKYWNIIFLVYLTTSTRVRSAHNLHFIYGDVFFFQILSFITQMRSFRSRLVSRMVTAELAIDLE